MSTHNKFASTHKSSKMHASRMIFTKIILIHRVVRFFDHKIPNFYAQQQQSLLFLIFMFIAE